ncbi:MAG: ATP-binding cassette domain-containing protein [Bdellovibrionaceae bacterium]|nr:ATP-binding cassette domain-containing protein [Pseudobdellovibrionaceae bacterium]
MHSAITAHGVTFELPNGRTLFENLNFTLDVKLTALVGPNGIGKTTLAKLISGELSPSSGVIRKGKSVAFFHQRENPKEIAVQDYLSSRYVWSILGAKLLEDIDQTLLCSHLSGGQWMRVRLAAVMHEQFLILDEPSNDLDRDAKKILLNFLREYQHGILLISHDREFLNICNDVLELSNRGIEKCGNGFEIYERQKAWERENSRIDLGRAKRERDRAKADRVLQVERQGKRNRQGKEAGVKTGMSKILIGARKRHAQTTTGKIDSSTMERANDRVKAAAEAFNEIKIDPVMYTDLMASEIPKQKLVAEAQDFNVQFGDKWLYKNDLNFSWRGSIRLAIKGANGSGKSTLVKALLGECFKTKGKLKSGKQPVLYLDQRCAILDDSKSVFENARNVTAMSERDVRNNLAKLLFFGDSVFQEVRSLSGGERLRAALARGLLSKKKPELIIFDEPTNNLDLFNIRFLEGLIADYKGAVVIISHDELFLNKCGVNQIFYV